MAHAYMKCKVYLGWHSPGCITIVHQGKMSFLLLQPFILIDFFSSDYCESAKNIQRLFLSLHTNPNVRERTL